jgi:hypothetical protein
MGRASFSDKRAPRIHKDPLLAEIRRLRAEEGLFPHEIAARTGKRVETVSDYLIRHGLGLTAEEKAGPRYQRMLMERGRKGSITKGHTKGEQLLDLLDKGYSLGLAAQALKMTKAAAINLANSAKTSRRERAIKEAAVQATKTDYGKLQIGDRLLTPQGDPGEVVSLFTTREGRRACVIERDTGGFIAMQEPDR